MLHRQVRVGVDERLSPELLAGFPEQATIVRIPEHPEQVLDVDVWILPFHRKDAADVFARLRGVKVIQSLMAGVEWILPWLPKDVVLCDGRGIHDISASEWVLGAILSAVKRFPVYRDKQLRGEWRGWGNSGDDLLDGGGANQGQYRVLGDDLAGKTVLIVGFGSIGQAIEDRLNPFGVNIVRLARTPRAQPEVHGTKALHTLLPHADIVVVIVPMTPETRGLIGVEEIGLMRRGALLVNAARGPVVDTAALLAALVSGKITAALDVTDPEPLPPGHPLWTAPNCFITPHVGGSTPQFIHRGYAFAARQIGRFVDGKELENVVQESGY